MGGSHHGGDGESDQRRLVRDGGVEEHNERGKKHGDEGGEIGDAVEHEPVIVAHEAVATRQ